MTDFIVFSKTNCPQCVQAKNMIATAGKTYEEKIFGENLTREELLAEFPAARMMPQIKAADGTKLTTLTELKEFLSY